jgi:hypothetical protein
MNRGGFMPYSGKGLDVRPSESAASLSSVARKIKHPPTERWGLVGPPGRMDPPNHSLTGRLLFESVLAARSCGHGR